MGAIAQGARQKRPSNNYTSYEKVILEGKILTRLHEVVLQSS